jgi:hypothetical protein
MRRVRAKTRKICGGERMIDGDAQGDCRRLRQTADSNPVFIEV